MTSKEGRGWPRRWLLPTALMGALVLAGGIAMGALEWRPEGGELATVLVERGTVESTVTAIGAIQPKDYVDVGAQVSGQLQHVHVAIGDEVEARQLLAEIDPRVYATRVKANEARLAGLEAQLREREADLKLRRLEEERAVRLFATRAVSESARQTAETAVEVAAAQVDQLKGQIGEVQAQLEGDQANLGFARIYAPLRGTVVSTSAVEGQTLNANQTAPIILRIANLDTMTVWAKVAEADINRLRVGMPAWFTTLGMPDRRFTGTVTQLLPTPEIVNDVVLYNVLIDVPNPERLLMTSMTVQVFFELARAEDVPVVPTAALRAAPKEAPAGSRVVQVMTADGPVSRLVELGVTSRTSAEIRQGLEPGERIVAGPPPASASRR